MRETVRMQPRRRWGDGAASLACARMPGHFETETAITRTGDHTWTAEISPEWNINDNANGGYLLTPALRAARELTDHPDPLTVTTHFFRPGRGNHPAEIHAEVLKAGRTMSTASATLVQEGKPRLTMIAGFGDVETAPRHDAGWSIPMPDLPPPDECIDRTALGQGVTVALNGRNEIRVDPRSLETPGHDASAEMLGWARFRDGTDPSAIALPFFADAFPPTVFNRLGAIGWVPTLELTVHVRRRPRPGWLACQVWTDDLHNGTLIESVRIWDANGDLVAQGRQLGLLL